MQKSYPPYCEPCENDSFHITGKSNCSTIIEKIPKDSCREDNKGDSRPCNLTKVTKNKVVSGEGGGA